MEALYKEMDFSRQAIWRHQQKIAINSIKEETILTHVKEWRKRHPGMGARPLFYTIKNSGIQLQIGINRFEELLRKNNLNVGIKKTKKPFTSDGKGKDKYENLTNGLILNDINQLIVGDITYFGIGETFYYIFTLKDVYSQRILELIPSEDMKAINALKCIETAAKIRDPEKLKGCIHHTDNGSQYNAAIYIEKLNALGIKISRAGSCKENGSSEQLNHIMKNMYLDNWGISTFKELVKRRKEFMKVNNEERAIKQLDNLSPIQFEKEIRTIPLNERVKKQLYDFNTQ